MPRLYCLLDDPNPLIQTESTRLFRLGADDPAIRSALEKKLEQVRSAPDQIALIEQLEFALYPLGSNRPRNARPRPDSLEEWQAALSQGGDPSAGERVFLSSSTSCSQCHTLRHRGGKLGPELTNVGQSLNRAQIIQSILQPSDQFQPQYQAWFIKTKDGEIHQGLQLDHAAEGAYAGRSRANHDRLRVSRFGGLSRSPEIAKPNSDFTRD